MRDEETDRLQTLANAILNKRYISAEGICFMSKGQKFTSDPRLALIYYYCFGGHPEAFVFNDEHLREDESVKERLLNALDSPIGVEEYERWQQRSTQCKAVLSRAPPAVNFSSALTVLTPANHCCVYQIHFEYLKMSLQPGMTTYRRILSGNTLKFYWSLMDRSIILIQTLSKTKIGFNYARSVRLTRESPNSAWLMDMSTGVMDLYRS
ncbi:hypothetical protein F443_21614 [Phytophthora nicotianae P1569]|uniref:Uncharacterized protein n=1 Tax=Phytophthora nicotianae P1569 TaxID=1317065 RepID=V9DX25_PHYNI|nr:hypothetical protein F443_21614 [Phytophthora nicotianae P1569]